MSRRRVYYGSKTWAVLVVLRDASRPMDEKAVYDALKNTEPSSRFYHHSLARLVELGYADRHGPSGRYSYTITQAGKAFVLMDGGQA